MDKIALHLSVENLNVIMAALGRMPYETVFRLIQEISEEVGPQMQPKQGQPTP